MGNAKKRARKRKGRRSTLLIFGLLFSVYCLSTFLELRRFRLNLELTPVDAKEVCMLDDRYTPINNYPTVINGSTYYCCEKDCSEFIKKPNFSINATDPYSGVQVSKANSFYGRAKNGRIYYFETIENLSQFPPKVNAPQ